MRQDYVEFYSPGTFFPEVTRKEIDSWNVDLALEMSKDILERYGTRPYSFRFITSERTDDELDAKVVDRSNLYYFGCDVLTKEEVTEALVLRNMEYNDISKVAVPREGWKGYYAISEGDIVLD